MRFDQLTRRGFIGSVGCGAMWPSIIAAQQRPSIPVIGYLSSTTVAVHPAFRKGLQDAGFVEGQNVAIEFRTGAGQYDRLAEMAADLVARRVDVICANPTVAALAAKAATSTIPIVFAIGGDPVGAGLVSSLTRPTGNLTGISRWGAELGPKRLQLLHDLAPSEAMLALLVNPRNPNAESETQAIQRAAETIGRKLLVVKTGGGRDFEAAFATLLQERPAGLIVATDAQLSSQRYQIVALAARMVIPAIFPFRENALAGGLMSYAANEAEALQQYGNYVGRILKGAKPQDLPVMLPTKLEFVINLQTAKALGIKIPAGVLAIADEVIE